MGKSAPEAPPSPDPYATARAQTGSNVSTAVANTVLGNANETGPLGTVRYKQTGSYKLSEPVLDRDGKPTVNRRWVPDAGSTGPTPPDPSGGLGGMVNDGTGAASPVYGGGHWAEDAAMVDRDIPQWERIVEMSPEQKELYDRQVGVQKNLLDLAGSQSKRLQETLGQPLNFDGIDDSSNAIIQRILADNGSGSRDRVENALQQRMNPQLDRDRAALENTLVNQGFTRGSEGFRNELDSSNRQANDARLGIIAAGGQEQALQQSLQLQQLQAASTNRERQIQERMALRNAPINEISALLGQSQVSMPQFSPYQAGTIANTPVGDYVYRSADIDQKNYQSQMQQSAATTGGLFGLGSSLIGAAGKAGGFGGLFALSDRRAKAGIRQVGSLRNGLPLYVYRYRGEEEEQLGLMADEVETLYPEAVREFGGFKHVNYEMAVL